METIAKMKIQFWKDTIDNIYTQVEFKCHIKRQRIACHVASYMLASLWDINLCSQDLWNRLIV